MCEGGAVRRLALLALVLCAVPAAAREHRTRMASCPDDGYEAVMRDDFSMACAPSATLIPMREE